LKIDQANKRVDYYATVDKSTRLQMVAQQLQASDQNDFALLDCIGGECAGAVTFLKSGQVLPAPNLIFLQDNKFMRHGV